MTVDQAKLPKGYGYAEFSKESDSYFQQWLRSLDDNFHCVFFEVEYKKETYMVRFENVGTSLSMTKTTDFSTKPYEKRKSVSKITNILKLIS